MATAYELLDLWVGTFNDGDIDAFEAHVAPNAALEEVGTGRRMTRSENTTSAKAWKAAFPEARDVIDNQTLREHGPRAVDALASLVEGSRRVEQMSFLAVGGVTHLARHNVGAGSERGSIPFGSITRRQLMGGFPPR